MGLFFGRQQAAFFRTVLLWKTQCPRQCHLRRLQYRPDGPEDMAVHMVLHFFVDKG